MRAESQEAGAEEAQPSIWGVYPLDDVSAHTVPDHAPVHLMRCLVDGSKRSWSHGLWSKGAFQHPFRPASRSDEGLTADSFKQLCRGLLISQRADLESDLGAAIEQQLEAE